MAKATRLTHSGLPVQVFAKLKKFHSGRISDIPERNKRSLYNLNCSRVRNGALSGGSVSELPVVMVVEDEYDLQGIIEEALVEGGFETDILSSGEEALTLFRGRLKNYKALVTDVGLKGRLSGWEVAAHFRESDPSFPIGGKRASARRNLYRKLRRYCW